MAGAGLKTTRLNNYAPEEVEQLGNVSPTDARANFSTGPTCCDPS